MKRDGTLDALRGVAILMVLGAHTADHLEPLGAASRHWFSLFVNAGAGVRLFFVLSGYLITRLLLEERSRSGRISLGRFYSRRALRIFPAFYAYLGVIILLQHFRPAGITASTIAAASTFTWNYALLWVKVPPEGYWNLGHFWTLALEQQFYLLWAPLLAFAGTRRSLWAAAAVCVWCPLARVATYLAFPAQRGLIDMMTHTALDSLMIGCIAALIEPSPRVRRTLDAFGGAGAAVAAICLLLLSPLAEAGIRGYLHAAGITLDAIAVAWIILWLRRRPDSRAAALLAGSPLRALGTVSYSLYLWQQVFLCPDGPLSRGHVLGPWLAALAAALASYLLIERPALRLKSRVAAPVPAPAAAACP